MERKRSEKNIKVDYSVPINKTEIIEMADTDCFGKMYDIQTRECNRCSLRDVCCIVFRDALEVKSDAIEAKLGSKFLDKANMKALTDKVVLGYIKSGETSVADLITYCKEISQNDDRVAIVNFLKSWIKGQKDIYTKDGIVWKR